MIVSEHWIYTDLLNVVSNHEYSEVGNEYNHLAVDAGECGQSRNQKQIASGISQYCDFWSGSYKQNG